MSQHKSLFRSLVDSMIESRARQAAREVAYYQHQFRFDDEPATKR